ncbi:helix-turn-helix domain-containing protein [Sphingomonas sp. ac-8]|uniref:helix-turn-helix domain-containing protein n=1 Tax=Sphingomonas sp. ac-8 TaxID=3242977 RepID=UPI003A8122D6
MTLAEVPAESEGAAVDPWRAFVFPNRVRELRQNAGFPTLMGLSAELPHIPYIRLSKIERGEVFARSDELTQIATALSTEPDALLLDIDAPDFDLADWAAPFLDPASIDWDEERFAVLLAAALRARRHDDRALTLARLGEDFGLPPVVVSRLENAQKPLGRWGAGTIDGLCAVFGVKREHTLRRHVLAQHRSGALVSYFPAIGGPEARLARTRERTAELVADLARLRHPLAPPLQPPIGFPEGTPMAAEPPSTPRMLPVFGSALAGGLIADTPTPDRIEAPAAAGPRAYGLRLCRATLGLGMPSNATLVVDPDRYPVAGGLAVLREADGYRVLAVLQDRNGAMQGHSVAPEIEIALDEKDPADVAAVIAASFV